jgi:hypothetical protein
MARLEGTGRAALGEMRRILRVLRGPEEARLEPQPGLAARRRSGLAFGEKRGPPRVRGRPLSRSADPTWAHFRRSAGGHVGRPVSACPIALYERGPVVKPPCASAGRSVPALNVANGPSLAELRCRSTRRGPSAAGNAGGVAAVEPSRRELDRVAWAHEPGRLASRGHGERQRSPQSFRDRDRRHAARSRRGGPPGDAGPAARQRVELVLARAS